MSLQLLVILVPVLFAFMGFAFDLGRLYMIRGELNQAANAMALAAASQLMGAAGSTNTNVNAAAQLTVDPTSGNKFNFGLSAINGSGTLASASTVTCFSSMTDASANNTGASVDCGSAPPVYVQASITADAPLLFWSLLPGGSSRRTSVASMAVAGVSAPLCTACGTTPIAVGAVNVDDTTDFGFIQGSLYTLYFSCTGRAPAAIIGDAVPYVVLNRVDTALDETDQLFRQGAAGLNASINPTPNACTNTPTTPASCISIGDTEQLTPTAVPGACTAVAPPTDVLAALCGLMMRIDPTDVPGNCQTGITDYGSLSALYAPDTDSTYITDYSAYNGNGRRIITVPVVNVLATNSTCDAGMTVLGFRQFLLEIPGDGALFSPTDQNGRFVAMYIGNPAPVAQGWFDTRYAPACVTPQAAGPGKVVLHQ